MPNVSLPSVAKGTGLHNGTFQRARLLLTLMYTVLLAAILTLAASVTYSTFSSRLAGRFARLHDVPPRVRDIPDVDLVRRDLRFTLFVVNGALLAAAGTLSYVLAGATLRPIQDAYERQRMFLADASHELRTPLAVLRLTIDNARAQLSNPPASLADASHAVTHMTTLVNDLLTIARVDSMSGAATSGATALAPAITAAMSAVHPLADERHIALRSALDADVTVHGDDTVVRCALTNVITNAVKYNVDHGTVDIALCVTGSTARVTVTDTGVGIPAEDLPFVFDRFYRSEKSRTREMGGSGLGLSIVAASMRSINGDVQIESTTGKGTVVTLIFPVHKAS